MSESLPPVDEGPDPYEGLDLDGLLSGDNCYVPDSLRRVIPALDALRAGPMRAELSAEAAARAYFRKVVPSGRGGPGRPYAPADEAPILTALTPAPGGPHLARRPHRHRRPLQRGRWPARALAGLAAGVAVLAGVAAFAGTYTGSGGHPAAVTLSRNAAAGSSASTANAVDGSATPEPATSGAAQQSGDGQGPSPAELCREYLAHAAPPGQDENASTQSQLYQRLSSLAGGQGDVGYYCMRVLQLWAVPKVPGGDQSKPGYPLPGRQQGQQGSPDSQGSQGNGGNGNGNSGNGNSGNGNSGNGNGNGNSGNGNGNGNSGNGNGSGSGG